MLCFLETPVLRFALLPYYRRIGVFLVSVLLTLSWYLCYGITGDSRNVGTPLNIGTNSSPAHLFVVRGSEKD